ncbi:hypothetical protein ABI59_18610 [Acidobacteria bacterium Mor1]|nr:hypothetical protein ABI59_18610 [Acidobacteria bacterium Mor1]
MGIGIAIVVWIGIILAVLSVIAMIFMVPLVDALDALARKLGLSKAYPGRSTGQITTALVRSPFTPGTDRSRATGKVEANGELWDAECSAELASTLNEGDQVQVRYGSSLRVEIVEKAEAP